MKNFSEKTFQLIKLFSRNKLEPVLQTENSECGLACLCMILGFYGFHTDLITLRQKFNISLRGVTLVDLINLANQLNFSSRPLRLDLEELGELKTPSILHWDLNHFVVLKKVTDKGAVIIDPARGERFLKFNEIDKHFTGVALELTPNNSFLPKQAKQKLSFSTFWQKIVGLKQILLQVFGLALALQVFALITPLFMQTVVDQVLLSNDTNLLVVLALGFGLLMLIDAGTTALRALIILNFSSLLSMQLGANLFRHLIRLKLPFFERRHIGDIVSRFGSLDKIQQMLSSGIVQAIVDGLMAILTLTMMFIYAPKLAFVVITAFVIYTSVRFILYQPLRQLSEENIVMQAKENSNFLESVRGIQSIKLFNQETPRQILWQNKYADKINSAIKLGKLNITFSSINSILFGIENILVIYLGAKLVLATSITVGMLFAFMSYKNNFVSKASSLIEKLIEFKMLNLHLERLADIALSKPEADLMPASSSLEKKSLKLTGSIEIQNLAFKFEDNLPSVFEDLNLQIKAGESIAIIGPSGCGKTTLLKLVLGLFTPSFGKILYDGVDLAKIDANRFRSQIGVVMQNDQLLSGSINDNISFFDPKPNYNLIEQCAGFAQISQDIAQMPMGYNTLIGDMGASLSGGQIQRILLARALYKQPQILFLDEATSHLDVNLEKAVNSAINSLAITRIIIAHRPETIKSVDRVLKLTALGLEEVSRQESVEA